MAREPAYSPRAARDRFVRIIQQPLTCITKSVWCDAPTLLSSGEDERALRLSGMPDPIRLRRDGRSPVYLTATQGYRLIPDERYVPGGGEWKASTTGYNYTMYETDEHQPKRVLAWHYHPNSGGSNEPHVHIYRDGQIGGVELDKLHFPGERVAFESVVAFAITELGVTPQRPDWEQMIASALDRFVVFRSWPRSGGPQPEPN